MLKWLQRLLILILFFALTVTNLVAITSTAIGATLSSILASAIGRKPQLIPAPNLARVALQSQLDSERERNRRMKQQLDTQIANNRALVSRMDRHRASIRSMGRNLVSRSKRIAVVTLAEIPAGAIPFAGVAVLVTGAAWELKQLCDGLKEMESLYRGMDIDEPIEDDALQVVCHPKLPSWGFNDDQEP